MESGDKGQLGSMFDDFEFEPRPELWDRIESQSVGPEEAGNMAPVFADYSHAPHSRVWRAIAHQLQPGRRRRAVIWWSVAAGIVLLVGLGVVLRTGQGLGADGESAVGEWAAGDEVGRLIREAESGVDGVGAIAWRDSLQAFFADGNGNCINMNPYQVLPFDFNFPIDQFWDQHQYPMLSNEWDLKEYPYPNGYPDYNGPTLGMWPMTPSELEESAAFADLMQSGIESRTPNLLEMESEATSFTMSYVDLAKVKREKPGLETRLGSNLSPTANLVALSKADMNLADVQSNGIASSGGYTGLEINALAESLDDGSEEVFRTPISIGFAMQWYLTERWSMLPGLVFQRLRSEIDDALGGDGDVHKYTRDYLGITAGVQYDLVQRDWYQLYATGGLQYDLGLRINDNRETLASGQAVSRNSIGGPLGNQAGGAFGMGMRYKVGKRVGIYAQGTVTNYFYQSEYNLWSTKSYWPNAQVGLTLSL